MHAYALGPCYEYATNVLVLKLDIISCRMSSESAQFKHGIAQEICMPQHAICRSFIDIIPARTRRSPGNHRIEQDEQLCAEP